MTRTAAISVRVEPDLKTSLEKLATEDDRTLAQYVERVLVAHVKEKGSSKKAR
ncbi:MAG: hypothetical protein QOG66_3459 [Methylobacteriaceae bacterium]|jgi:predicted transcriptional regulator|nr:hypothetical protein [Methylobacteriaceae bacterium]